MIENLNPLGREVAHLYLDELRTARDILDFVNTQLEKSAATG